MNASEHNITNSTIINSTVIGSRFCGLCFRDSVVVQTLVEVGIEGPFRGSENRWFGERSCQFA